MRQKQTFAVLEYDLDATLGCGQAFRWQQLDGCWDGVIAGRWVRLKAAPDGIIAATAQPTDDWGWLRHYLQLEVELEPVLRSFPRDEAMLSAVGACRGLRLLRQDPWECLASFILSSTKQIVQIQQIIRLLCARFGEPVAIPEGHAPAHAFPTARRLAEAGEQALRDCKMGFRAPYLLETARIIAAGGVDLNRLAALPLARARQELLSLPGVGPKIADCVLLFAFGFQAAFPVDVWVMRALKELYFPRRRPARETIVRFTENYFGEFSGYAQQYLFHYMRSRRLIRPGKT